MKGFIALVLALVPQALAGPLAIPLHLALSYDEEVGCLGVPALIRALPEGMARPRLAIIGEPTEMQVANAHKGIHFLRTRVTGHEAHSSMPERGVNAIAAAAEIIAEIGRLAAECRAAAAARQRASTRPTRASTSAGSRAAPRSTSSPATAPSNGSSARSPARTARRCTGGSTISSTADLLPRLRAGHPEAACRDRTLAWVPPLVPDPASPAEALARAADRRQRPRRRSPLPPKPGLFQSAGIPAVICGPGSIDVAHQPNEYITRDQLAAGAAFLDRLLAWARRGGP